jgi:hypothetical protein
MNKFNHLIKCYNPNHDLHIFLDVISSQLQQAPLSQDVREGVFHLHLLACRRVLPRQACYDL